MSAGMALSIADALIARMTGASTLNAVRLFIRGYAPMDVPGALMPYVEVIVAQDDDTEQYSGGLVSPTYTGLITINVNLQANLTADWLNLEDADRVVSVPSYDAVINLAAAIIDRLAAQSFKSLGDLAVGNEAVERFDFTGPRTYGLTDTERADTWTNFGSLPFEVQTVRQS